MGISTHVLDASLGMPAAGMTVALYRKRSRAWTPLSTHATDKDGRVAALTSDLEAGVYRLVFDTDTYFQVPSFYPDVTITFRIDDPAAHYHVPLLLSPFAYSTYRGS
jgi:5-hydroxyisourate hydrolase